MISTPVGSAHVESVWAAATATALISFLWHFLLSQPNGSNLQSPRGSPVLELHDGIRSSLLQSNQKNT